MELLDPHPKKGKRGKVLSGDHIRIKKSENVCIDHFVGKSTKRVKRGKKG